MEKRKVCSTFKMRKVNHFITMVFLFSLTSCGLSGNLDKKTENIPGTNMESPELFNRILALNASGIGNSAQVIIVTNDTINSTGALIQTFEKKDRGWVKKFSDFKGSVGYHGFSPFQEKREGDNTSPTGIFDLGPVFGYDKQVTTQMAYRQSTEKDFWIDDTNSDDYNKWVTLESPPTVSHEKMKRNDDLYKLGIVVQYNTQHIVKGNGSAIFVHIQRETGHPTAGCVALSEVNLLQIIQWLQPDKKPIIVMGTESELHSKAFNSNAF